MLHFSVSKNLNIIKSIGIFLFLLSQIYAIKPTVRECDSRTEYTCEADSKSRAKCIPLSWKCDNTPDCENRDDERDCSCHSNSDFRCKADEKCIPEVWVCDQRNDCSDGADEVDCPEKIKPCASGYIGCGNATSVCIPLRWKCDGVQDCSDNSDESGCVTANESGAAQCARSEWRCRFGGACISKTKLCDMIDDCDDRSDEDDASCPPVSVNCPMSSDFSCQDDRYHPTCIHKMWVCDDSSDCPNGLDESEAVCHRNTVSAPVRCDNSTEFTCETQPACIALGAYCNGRPDCADKSDEIGCQLTANCSETQFACRRAPPTPGAPPSRRLECVGVERLCDGVDDCLLGSDEKDDRCSAVVSGGVSGHLSSAACQSNPCPVDHECVDTHFGDRYYCTCGAGWTYSEVEHQCVDIDECATQPSICSQFCNNTIGSYKCSCRSGYMAVGSSCVSEGGAPSLIFANREDIRVFRFGQRQYDQLVTGPNCIALDYGIEHKILVWSDTRTENLYWRSFNGTVTADKTEKREFFNRSSKLVSNADLTKSGGTRSGSMNITTPDGVAYDWIHGNLYWTDTGTNAISVIDVTHFWSHTVVSSGLDEPRAIVVDPIDGFMYWTDWGAEPKIERAGLDGSHRAVLVRNTPTQTTLGWPNGLAMDHEARRLYWGDGRLHVIASCDLQGGDVRVVVGDPLLALHPFAVDVFEDTVYWSDWGHQRIIAANKFTGAPEIHQTNSLEGSSKHTMDIKIYHRLKQPKGPNQCANRHCSHICLPAPRMARTDPGYRCLCPRSLTMLHDNHTCDTPGAKPYAWLHSVALAPPPTVTIDASSSSQGLITMVIVAIIGSCVIVVVAVLYLSYRRRQRQPPCHTSNGVYRNTTVLIADEVSYIGSAKEARAPLTQNDILAAETEMS